MNDKANKKGSRPYVKIIEQPLSRGARFRYQCEGRYAGSIVGVNNTRFIKSFPTIEIVNHDGPAFVVVSCVMKDPPYPPHPHNLVGKGKELAQGICYFKIPPNQKIITFPNLGVQCVKRKDIDESLTERERLKVDPFKTGFDHKYKPENIDLTCVRLCFQVFLEGKVRGLYDVPLDPVVSCPIYDKKAAAELAIRWISHASASVAGGKVMCILSEKIVKDDIEVLFFDDETGWEAIAETISPHVHKQVAVVFKTPKYFMNDIDNSVSVRIQLKRPSDGERSRPVPFQLLPLEVEDHDMLRKKRQKYNESPKSLVLRHLQAEAAKSNAAKKNNEKSELWGLTSSQTQITDSATPLLPTLYPQMKNHINNFSEQPFITGEVPNNYDTQQMQLNQMDNLIQNLHQTQTPRFYNNSTMIQQKHNDIDQLNFEFPSIHEMQNEPPMQLGSNDLDILITNIVGENFSNNLLISGDL